jgi:arylsulfatase A-like enzyme
VDLERSASGLRWRWIIDGDWKLIVPASRNEPEAKVELYRITEDPKEEKDLAVANVSEVERPGALLDQW